MSFIQLIHICALRFSGFLIWSLLHHQLPENAVFATWEALPSTRSCFSGSKTSSKSWNRAWLP